MIRLLATIFIGGGIGSVLRYSVQVLLHERITAYNFPWATFAVNIAGSFLIGLFYAISAKFNLSEQLRLFLTAGICGGFTTFSTFSYDNLAMLKNGDWLPFTIYTAISVTLGIIACFAGSSIGKL